MSSDVRDIERLLIATDGSASAREAVDVGVDLAQEEGSEVTLVHVVARSSVAAEADEPLQSAARLARDRGIEPDVLVRTGDPVEETARLAEDIDADLVIVGSRGLDAELGALLGSVSRGLAARCQRPVLVVRGARPRSVA